MTRRLYYEDGHCLRFSATVTGCQPVQGGFAVTLDQTAFYPEGGGQPADRGTLNGIAVLDVQEPCGEVVHLCSAPLTPGAAAEGLVDAAWRRDLVEQHSGEHIISGLICSHFHCHNVGFHIGGDAVTIDFDTECTWEQLLPLEAEANRLIREDLAVEIFTPAPAELAALDYRSKKALDGPVRLVRFPRADLCACCGLHVARTGELGLLKLLSCSRSRGGVRIALLSGARALNYVNQIWEQNQQISRSLSAKPLETAAAVTRLLEENTALKLRLSQAEEASFAARAAALRGTGSQLLLECSLSPDSARRLATAVAGEAGGTCAVFTGEDTRGYQYAIVSPDRDLRALAPRLNHILRGRGGGRPDCIQGAVQATWQEIQNFWETQGEA